ncbi:MAG: type II CRISPR RNA-guided endonuclease Cas9 [Alphaproteobacteria bacterium]|nr:type II CRISPR RNA-guided endonuclease Cas9 [Alphaproteobacteria bacterium]
MTYTLGIDVGIASIGFAGVNQDQGKIVFCGTHIFEAAENPKDGASLASPRREKRGMRRVISRRRQRKKQIRALLAKHGLKDIDLIDQSKTKACTSPWLLRKEALERLLTDSEFVRILFHIAKRRGFQSNKKGGTDQNDMEGKKVLSGAIELEEKAIQSGAKTIASYLASQEKQRNGDGDYTNSIKRDALREEVKMIFEAQKKFGNIKATPELLYDYAGSGKKEERNTCQGDGIAFYQRSLQSSEHLVGFCTFEEGERRAPKCSYTAELFVIWSKLNNTRIKDVKSNERTLTQDEKNRLSDLAHKNKSGVTYKQARKELRLIDDERFNIGYRKLKDDDNSWEKIRDNTEKSVFLKFTGYHALKDALDTGGQTDWQNWINNRRTALDDIAHVLSFYEDRKEVDDLLSVHGLREEEKKKLSSITNFSKTVDLSLKAIYKILPHLQNGLRYDEACKQVWGHHGLSECKSHALVPPFDDIRNPVVNRALAQTRKVINACIRQYGKPDTIIVELARDVGRNFKDRKDIEREQKKNEAYKNEAKQHAAEILGIIPDNVTGEDILKYRLLQEQQHFCFYCGSKITPEQFQDGTAVQIDHIIPYSRSWNNSYMNKTLCHSDCNQEKGNRTPYEWLGGTKQWNGIITERAKLPLKKVENFLIENFEDREQGWKDRALNDTRYIAKLLRSHLADSLDVKVQTRNGALTSNLRHSWGLGKKNRENDRHHAQDAIILACSTQSMVQKFSNWNKYEARKKNPTQRLMPPKPWATFRDDVLEAIDGIFVSRMPVRKITGAAHEETIRSIRKSDGKVIQRVKLKSLKLSQLENLVDKERNIKLYNLLRQRLEEYGDKSEKAFADPVYMPVNDSSKIAPRVNSVRIETKEKSGITINHGLASNGDMVRVDVFMVNGKYQLVPIYVHHFVQDKLPNKAIVASKDEKDWLEVSDEDFLFSLYKNDLVHIKNKKEEFIGYYNGTHRGTGAINIRTHDSDPSFGKNGVKEGIGVKSLLIFDKYNVDYFGNKHKVKKEKRLGVAKRIDTKSRQPVPAQGAVEAAE